MKNHNKNNYYSGGLAELLPHPSNLSYSFFKNWFTGEKSVGLGMKLLNLPYNKTDIPILEIQNNELVVNLNNEEHTIYAKTIFSYSNQSSPNSQPKLKVRLVKIINPICITNTLKILLRQSNWIANQEKILKDFEKQINDIPEEKINNISEIYKILEHNVWPKVIAVGFLAEFYHQVLAKEKNYDQANKYSASQISKNDWFFKSISDQQLVKSGEITFENFIKEYGLRSDIDYEIMSPRWHEIENEIKKRIIGSHNPKNDSNFIDIKITKIITTNIQIQLIRSQAKRKALFYIDLLRKELLKKAEKENISDLKNSKFDMHSMNFTTTKNKEDEIVVKKSNSTKKSGKGSPVSMGQIKGIILNISNNNIYIPPGTIGIFPNASPEFAPQFPKCAGLIFLTGGLTSHGSIVAREFGIPAIIDQDASNLKDGLKISIIGETGEWELV